MWDWITMAELISSSVYVLVGVFSFLDVLFVEDLVPVLLVDFLFAVDELEPENNQKRVY